MLWLVYCCKTSSIQSPDGTSFKTTLFLSVLEDRAGRGRESASQILGVFSSLLRVSNKAIDEVAKA